MISTFELFVALRYCLGHKRDRLSRLITLLSGIGLVLGVAMMITVLSVMNGFDRELREKILVVVPHIKLYTGANIADWQPVAEELMSHPDVTTAHPYSELDVLLSVRGEVEPMLLYAIDSASESEYGRFGQLVGEGSLKSLSVESNGMLLGAGLALSMGVEAGDAVSVLLFGDGNRALKTARYRVSAILHTGTEADQRVGIIDLQALSAIPQQSTLPTGLRVQTTKLFETRSIAYELLNRIGFGYRASTWAMTHGNLYELIQMSRNLVALIVLLILAIAAFNLIATLMISSADKQGELAVLKTIGASPRSLAKIFAIQGLVIGIVGSSVGAAVGVLLSTQLRHLTSLIEFFTGEALLQSTVYPLDYLPSDLDLTQIVVVVMVAILLSVLAAVYPAWKVSKVDPAQILRYE